MKVKDIKASLLKLIEADSEEIVGTNVSTLEGNDTYSAYLKSFDVSLDRAIQRIVTLNKTPLKSLEIELNDTRTEYEIECNDIKEIYKIFIKNESGETKNISYMLLGNKYLSLQEAIKGKAYVYYYRTIPLQLTFDDEFDLSELGISDMICSIIPYFIKGEVYEADEPDKALLARNIFATYLEQIQEDKITIKQVRINYGY